MLQCRKVLPNQPPTFFLGANLSVFVQRNDWDLALCIVTDLRWWMGTR
jgi:hypothetical protein